MRVTGVPSRIVVMGVTSTGKTETGGRIARTLGLPFVDGDDLHPPRNRRKMAGGTPLTDADRRPWLDRIGAVLAERPRVVACSALKRHYRDRIRSKAPGTLFVHLHGPRDLIAWRMTRREGHFMPVSLLDSQLATLEPPGPDERAVRLDIRHPPRQLLATLIERLRQPR